jgi:hypothetical protein
MYFTIAAVFCVGFVIGMAFGMVRGKKELIAELQQSMSDFEKDVQDKLNTLLENKT